MKKYISIILAVALTLCAGAPVLASGLSGEEPAVAAPASLSGEGLVTDAFTYDYGDEWGAYAYHIPKIDRPEPGIQAVNDAIWRAFYDDVMDSDYGPLTAIHEGWSAEPYSINYDWAVNGDVLSLWVWCSYSGDCNYYTVYNVSLTSGRKIADSELLDALGLDQAKYYARMGQVLSDAFEQSCAFCPEDELKQEQRQANNAAANIRAAQPYLGENGDLCAIGTACRSRPSILPACRSRPRWTTGWPGSWTAATANTSPVPTSRASTPRCASMPETAFTPAPAASSWTGTCNAISSNSTGTSPPWSRPSSPAICSTNTRTITSPWSCPTSRTTDTIDPT